MQIIFKISASTLLVIIVITFNSCKGPCKDTNCLNGGICNEGDCDYPAGYSGKNCETYNPSYNVTCYNGGTCVNGACDCPTGFTGSNCQAALNLASVIITKVVINQNPPSNNGFYWDAGPTSVKYPDIFLSLSLYNPIPPNHIQWTGYKTNVTSTPVTFSSFLSSSTLAYPNSNCIIGVWDSVPDDLMVGVYILDHPTISPVTLLQYTFQMQDCNLT